ncbi:MAG: VCBS repeat-containing protein [Planctomycetes bacterium]|nr:VCBS repeat-containing protein [Planctomycetota bacterium]
MLLVLACALFTGGQAAQEPQRLVLAQTLEPGFVLAAHRWADLDGDKRSELALFGRAGEVRSYAHADGSPLFEALPRGTLQLADPRHTLLDLAQLSAPATALQLLAVSPAGVEIFALEGRGAFAAQGETLISRARFTLRVGQPTLAPMVQDANNDSRPDLVIPGPQACELWLNEGLPSAKDGAQPRWPAWRKAATVAVDLSSSSTRASADLSDVLASSFSIPALQTRDVNGDGRPDLLVVDGARRAFHLQREDGSFPAQPDVAVDLSIFRDSTEAAEVRPGHTLALDESASFQSRDLDGDGIPDYVVAHRRKVWVFHGSKAGPQFQKPSAILKAADDITALQLARLDDDAFPDLLLIKVQVPTIATLVRGVFGEWDVDVSAAGYLNREGKGFETSPSLKSDLVLRLPSILSILKQPEKILERFEDVRDRFRQSVWGDLDGSGTRDVALVSSDSRALEVWLAHEDSAAGSNSLDAEELLRKLLFEDSEKVWDIDRVVLWLGGIAERRTALLTGGRNPDGRIELRDPDTAHLAALECADVDGDGRAELLLRYELLAPARTVFDVLRWR